MRKEWASWYRLGRVVLALAVGVMAWAPASAESGQYQCPPGWHQAMLAINPFLAIDPGGELEAVVVSRDGVETWEVVIAHQG